MKLNIFEWVVRDTTKPISYSPENLNPRPVYKLSIRAESTGQWLWYVKKRYGLLISKFQTNKLWVEQYVSTIDTNPHKSSLEQKIKTTKAKLTKAENKLLLAEKIAAETLDFGENDLMLERQRAKVDGIRKELNNLLNS